MKTDYEMVSRRRYICLRVNHLWYAKHPMIRVKLFVFLPVVITNAILHSSELVCVVGLQ